MKAITSSQMNVIDANCAYLGLSTLQLMENAGAAIAREVVSRMERGMVVFVAGRGNNGGDAFVAARHLDFYPDIDVKVILLGRSSQIRTEDALQNFNVLRHCEVEVKEVSDSTQLRELGWMDDANVIVDAVLGTGVRGHIREPESTAIDLINDSSALVLSVDVPSGLDPDGGVFWKSVFADVTLTFHRMKTGLVSPEAKEYTGDVKIINIGVCSDAEGYVGRGNLEILKRPSPGGHKGQAGKVLVIGGGAYSGAPGLAAMAALRTGADIVTLAVPGNVANVVASFSPNLIVRTLSGDRLSTEDLPVLSELINSHDVVVMGMGLGKDNVTKDAVAKIIPMCSRLVIDADALHGLDFPVDGCEIIITPHAGEFASLTGRPAPAGLDERVEAVISFSEKHNVVTLLKGQVDIISDGERVLLNRTGNPGMTVGGTGDVLAGIVGALFAVNLGMDAASCGAFINGAAGDLAFEERGKGLLATDVIEKITEIIR